MYDKDIPQAIISAALPSIEKTDPDYLSLREDFDRCTYINTLTREQRDGFYKRDYDFMNAERDARIEARRAEEATL